MTAKELWAIYTANNPSFDGYVGTVTMSKQGLRKLFFQTYETGRKFGFDNGKALAEMNEAKHINKARNPFPFFNE